ncbi:MAG TPA: hypothetical protein VHQ87_08610, partial [Rhizobacter sp.]|nr:hypothetical protein [Rhizobacter sp.]
EATEAAAQPAATAAKKSARKSGGASEPTPQAVDPMQWWGALTKQFTQLATSAMKDTATDAAKNLAGAMVKQSVDAAGETIKKAAGVPAKVAAKASGAARKRTASKAAAKAPSAR